MDLANVLHGAYMHAASFGSHTQRRPKLERVGFLDTLFHFGD